MKTPETADSIGTADGLTEAIVALVGSDGEVTLESPVAEFERIVHVTPQVSNAVVLDVMVGHEDENVMPGYQGLVVVWARRPSLGWWTFDDMTDGDGHRAAWKVFEQIVDRGGAADLARRDRVLLDPAGVPVYEWNDRFGKRRRRLITFPSYRSNQARDHSE